jgi:hypothetical protein
LVEPINSLNAAANARRLREIHQAHEFDLTKSEPPNPSAPNPAGRNSAIPINIDYVLLHNVDLVVPTNNKKTPYGAVEVRKPMTPKFEVLIWKRITKELKPSKRKTHS